MSFLDFHHTYDQKFTWGSFICILRCFEQQRELKHMYFLQAESLLTSLGKRDHQNEAIN